MCAVRDTTRVSGGSRSAHWVVAWPLGTRQRAAVVAWALIICDTRSLKLEREVALPLVTAQGVRDREAQALPLAASPFPAKPPRQFSEALNS